MAVRHRRPEQISFKKLCDMGSLDPGDLRSELDLKCLGEHGKWFKNLDPDQQKTCLNTFRCSQEARDHG